jgi:hypothetical protein
MSQWGGRIKGIRAGRRVHVTRHVNQRRTLDRHWASNSVRPLHRAVDGD